MGSRSVRMVEDDAEHRRLAEMARTAERVVDRQVRALEASDEKSQRALTLAVAALAGGLALGSLALERDPGRFEALGGAALVAGGVLNLTALVRLVDAYTGLRGSTSIATGPAVLWLKAKAMDVTWTLADHYRSLIGSLATYEGHNARLLSSAARRRGQGLMLLLFAVALYATAFFYIVARTLVT